MTDVRFAFVREDTQDGQPIPIYREVTLAQLRPFLEQILVANKVDAVYSAVVVQLNDVWDYTDTPASVIEEISRSGGGATSGSGVAPAVTTQAPAASPARCRVSS
jgi:hypothetical protein